MLRFTRLLPTTAVLAAISCANVVAQVPTYLPQPTPPRPTAVGEAVPAYSQPTPVPGLSAPSNSCAPSNAYTPANGSAPSGGYVPSNGYAPTNGYVPSNGAAAGPPAGYGGATYGGPSGSLPGYGTMQGQPQPGYGIMPKGTFSREDFHRFGGTTPPGRRSQWVSTYSKPLLPGCGPQTECSPYGGGGPMTPGPTQCYPACDPCLTCGNWYDNVTAFMATDAFKNALDLDGLNANFGSRVGLNAAFPIWQAWGLGAQLGSSAGWYDWKGSQFTGSGVRFQNFNTVGVFHRSCTNGLGFGVVYDWLFDDYYRDLSFGQFRVAGSWQFNSCNEVGVWAALPDRRDWAVVGTPPVNNNYGPLLQGNFYWRHVYNPGAWTTLFAGLAESPSDIPFGASGQVALNSCLALFGGFQYILPGSGGNQGRQEEIWNLSFGVALYPGTAMTAANSQFRAMLPIADNGNFAIRRR
jgi:hypothetical protein